MKKKRKSLFIFITFCFFISVSLFSVYYLGWQNWWNFERYSFLRDHPQWGYPRAVAQNYQTSEFEHSVDAHLMRDFEVDPNRKHHLILAGGSNTFGQGMTKSPKRIIEKKLVDYNVQLFAYLGWGPGHLLARLKVLKLNEMIPQEEGVFIYQFYPFHLSRVCGGESYYRWSHGVAPFYEIKNGKLVQDGLHLHQWKLHLAHIKLGVEYIQSKLGIKKDVSYKNELGGEHYLECVQLFEKVILELQDLYLDYFPKGKFMVVNMPITREVEPELLSMLETNKFHFVDTKDYFYEKFGLDRLDPPYSQEDNKHLTEQTYELLAVFYNHILARTSL